MEKESMSKSTRAMEGDTIAAKLPPGGVPELSVQLAAPNGRPVHEHTKPEVWPLGHL